MSSTYDSAGLLARFYDYADRPDTDQDLTSARVYRYLTDAQIQVVEELAALFPRLMMSAPTLMTSSDGGITYTLGADSESDTITPFGHAEVYAAADGRELFGSTYASYNGDVVFEGNKIRIPNGQTKTFDSGPYIRYVALPLAIDGSTEPTLEPKQIRNLILYRALVLWANSGGMQNPAPYEEMYSRAWNAALMLLTTQYRQAAYSQQAAIAYFRSYLATGGSFVRGMEV